MQNSRCRSTQTSREPSSDFVVARWPAAVLAVVGVLGCGGGGSQQADAANADSPSSTLPCIGEGETLIAAVGETCCPGLSTVACAAQQPIPDGSPGTAACLGVTYQCAVCVQGCGDGKCTLGENNCNCGQDCDPAANEPGCHPDDVPFDAPPGYWDWWLAGTTPATPYPDVNCCQLASRFYAYGDNCMETLEYPTQLICLSHCGDGKCEGMETPCSCPWDCITDTAGCYMEGYSYNPGTSPMAMGKDPGGCCPGLTAVNEGYPLDNGSGRCYLEPYGELMCLRCGDGACTGDENICNCPADCH